MRRGFAALVLFVSFFLSASALAQTPTAFGKPVLPLAQVDTKSLPALDRGAIDLEDTKLEAAGAPPRYAMPLKTSIDAKTNGTWETLDANTQLWRYHIVTPDATSLNLGFTKFFLPQGASLLLYTSDGKRVRGPFTSANNKSYEQFWTPVLVGKEMVVELTIPTAHVAELKLEIGQIGHGYRGFGVSGDKSGSCNMDVACLLPNDPWNDNARAVAMISVNGSNACSGSLINNTAADHKMYFITAHHCTVASAPATLVTYWNFENSTCRVPGSAASGGAGDGTLTHFNSGSVLKADYAASDFTLVELDDPPNSTFDLFWEGWDHTPYVIPGGPGNGDFACSPGSLCAAIHHPNTDEKRITFSANDTSTTSYNAPAIPGDGTHVHALWDPNPVFPPNPATSIPPQVTEPGSSGSPLYNAQRRYIGQLHGGPSACGATGGNLSDYYGKIAVSWEGGGAASSRLKDWLDPGNTGAMTADGINQCTAPPIPTGITAVANGANHIDVSWTAAAGADSYNVYRGDGACPGTNYQLIASGVVGTTYADTAVSGTSTYSYTVTSFSTAQTCESAHSTCMSATATGLCTMPPTFSGLASASSSSSTTCGVDLGWSAATANCGSSVKYNVFRSTTPAFTPGPANSLATCQTGTAYHDGSVASATQYYYAVRAEDGTANGAGACNSGNEDTNSVIKSATPTGPDAVAFTDDVEAGGANFVASGTGAVGANFAIATTEAHSPTHSWFAQDPAGISDRYLAFATAASVGPGTKLEFWHHYNTESTFDGAVLEYSLDGGTTWTDILAAQGVVPANANRFIDGGYTGPISSAWQSPIAGRQAWSGDSAGFVAAHVDMADFNGLTVKLRWRMASDVSVNKPGYWLDDIKISAGTTCGLIDTIFQNGFDPPN